MQIKFDYVYHHSKDGDYQHEQFTLLDIECGQSAEYTRAMQVDGYKLVSLRMYTGLKDKYGEELYAGDLWIARPQGMPYIITWHETGWYLFRQSTRLYENIDGYAHGEKIGNRHDNPELLEGTG